MKTKRKMYLLVPMVLEILLFSQNAAMASQPWTGVAGAFIPDESSLNKYESNAARFRHKGTQTGDIYAKCNVTSPISGDFYSGWSVLQVIYRDPDGSATSNSVTVELIRVSNSTGGVFTIATFNSNDFGASSSSQTHAVDFTHTFDFFSYAYYVQIKVSRTRSGATNNPDVSVVRLYEYGI